MKTCLKTLVPVVFALCSVYSAQAQDRIPVDLKPIRLSVGILEPSVLAEFKLSNRQSFVATGGITFAFSEDEGYVSPFVRGSLRHYYDRKRVKKDNLRTNSGNFVTLQGGYYFDSFNDTEITLDNYFFIGPAWGIQRNYNSGIHLSLSLGLGYGNGRYSGGAIASTGHFTFGFTFN